MQLSSIVITFLVLLHRPFHRALGEPRRTGHRVYRVHRVTVLATRVRAYTHSYENSKWQGVKVTVE
jgi:hypothetical protein